jgi:hypothetical protein
LTGTGHYIYIFSNGDLEVGENYIKNGEPWIRYNRYNRDGTEENGFDYNLLDSDSDYDDELSEEQSEDEL